MGPGLEKYAQGTGSDLRRCVKWSKQAGEKWREEEQKARKGLGEAPGSRLQPRVPLHIRPTLRSGRETSPPSTSCSPPPRRSSGLAHGLTKSRLKSSSNVHSARCLRRCAETVTMPKGAFSMPSLLVAANRSMRLGSLHTHCAQRSRVTVSRSGRWMMLGGLVSFPRLSAIAN